jgi:MraZ protein
MSQEVSEVDEGLGPHDLFLHKHFHRLDGKKRLTIPSDWRGLIGTPERVFVTKVEGRSCLRCLPAREASRRMAKLQEQSISDPRAEEHLENIALNSELVSWDSQGRIRICDELLDHAGLKSEVILVGKVNGFELWSPEKWKQKQSSGSQPGLSNSHQFAGL